MENDIALMTSGYLALRLGILAAIAYGIYRIMKPSQKSAAARSQSRYARERSDVTRPRQ
jgi:hypothetical protein